ncbi:hypothetical protein HPB51_007408 [Rhipicephalus microplus]|uniref:Secreted protein n=1 Tax=Rhipicephalus microplus TaxID=6941 RepID=A0A9J6EYI0_RHIMP|nr:hypothetical protein HPB51_007408 [Rhipicephalus microplus]
MLVLSLLGFLYQASEIVQEYLEHRSAVDLRIEGSGTLLYPGLSYCLTNWIPSAFMVTGGVWGKSYLEADGILPGGSLLTTEEK